MLSGKSVTCKSTKKIVRQISDISAKVCPSAANRYIGITETLIIGKRQEAICERPAYPLPLRHSDDVGDVVVQSVAITRQSQANCCLQKSNSAMVQAVLYTSVTATSCHIKEHYYQTRHIDRKMPVLLEFAETAGCIVVYYIRQRSQHRVYVTDRLSCPTQEKTTDDPRLFYKTQRSGGVVYESSKYRGHFLCMSGKTLTVRKKSSKIFTPDFLFEVKPYRHR
ncbi:uncharacterized protein [Ptychodera flava]|uniref:uncharacterized protein n=1 Tax=Ptychodera flava TaxID=63121 RepID=UPI00396A476B